MLIVLKSDVIFNGSWNVFSYTVSSSLSLNLELLLDNDCTSDSLSSNSSNSSNSKLLFSEKFWYRRLHPYPFFNKSLRFGLLP